MISIDENEDVRDPEDPKGPEEERDPEDSRDPEEENAARPPIGGDWPFSDPNGQYDPQVWANFIGKPLPTLTGERIAIHLTYSKNLN